MMKIYSNIEVWRWKIKSNSGNQLHEADQAYKYNNPQKDNNNG